MADDVAGEWLMALRDYPSRAQRVHRLAMRITGTPVADLERLPGGELAWLDDALRVACDELDVQAQADREGAQ